MKKYIKQISIVLAIAVIIAVGLSFKTTRTVLANQSVFNIKPFLTVGTTTPVSAGGTYAHLRAGFSTSTTPVLDSWASGTYGALDSATLLVQLTATSTAPTLEWRYEYSQDGIDWYSDDIALTSNASTTVHVRDFAEHMWVFASSTGGTSSNSIALKKLDVETPLRFTRAVFYLLPGSPNAAIFTQWVSKSQK